MLSVVQTEKGNLKGYIIDDFFIRKDLMKYFTPQTSFTGTKVIGKTVTNGVLVRSKTYKDISQYLNVNDYRKVIRAFTLNGIKLNDIIFVKCSYSDFSNISDMWTIIKDMQLRKLNYYICMDNNGNDLAYMMSSQDLYRNCIVYIHMFEVLEKQIGNGTRIINQLKVLNKTVKGLTLESAVDFWKKLGADIDNTNHFSL